MFTNKTLKWTGISVKLMNWTGGHTVQLVLRPLHNFSLTLFIALFTFQFNKKSFKNKNEVINGGVKSN